MKSRQLADNLKIAVPLWVQTEEDAETTIRALRPVCKGRLLCVASGGDTPLALLEAGAAEVIGADINPAQVAVAELKALTITVLDPLAFDAFWLSCEAGIREEIYCRVESQLSTSSTRVLGPWLRTADNRPLIERGGMQGIGTELMALRPQLFERLIKWFQTPDLETQRWYYTHNLRGLAGELARLRQARAEEWFGAGADVETNQAVAREMQERFVGRFIHLVNHIPVRGNPYAAHMILGRYLPDATLSYLTSEGRERIRPRLKRLRLVTGDLADVVSDLSPGSLDGADISNVTDLLGKSEASRLYAALHRALKPNSVLVHRNLIWDVPDQVAPGFRRDEYLSAWLLARDRSFVYSAVTVDRRE